MEKETKDCSSSGYIITFMKTYTTKSIQLIALTYGTENIIPVSTLRDEAETYRR
jgi:hypothetical protein